VSCALASLGPAAQPAQPPTSEQILFVRNQEHGRAGAAEAVEDKRGAFPIDRVVPRKGVLNA